MTYVAFLRAINVGGNAIVSMAAVKEALTEAGLSDVRTFLNSGNVIFSTAASDEKKLTTRIESALERSTGLAIRVLVMDHKALGRVVGAIPGDWVDDKTMRTYVLLLWKELDDPNVLKRLPANPEVDHLLYTSGAIVWHIDRKDLSKSRMNKMMGTPVYKKMTIRSANTMRKLNQLTS